MNKNKKNTATKSGKIEKFFNRLNAVAQPMLEKQSINLQIEISLTQPQHVSEVIQALSDQQLLDKVSLTIRPVVFRQISSQSPVKTIQTCYVQRMEDNTLQCKVCGRKLPSTHEGELDREQLALEMCLRTWSCFHP